MNNNTIEKIESLTEELEDILTAMKADETLDLLPEARNLVNKLKKQVKELNIKENPVKKLEQNEFER